MNWKETAGDAAGVLLAFKTCGLSLLLSPNARKLAKDVLGMDSEDSTTKKLDEIKAQNETWKAQMAANQAERDRLREEKEKNDRDKKTNNDEIARLNAIINNPHSSDEEKKNARNRIVLLEGEIKELKAKNKKLDENIEKLSKNPPLPSRSFSSYFPKLSVFDKIIAAGAISLMVYVVFIKEDKKKITIFNKKLSIWLILVIVNIKTSIEKIYLEKEKLEMMEMLVIIFNDMMLIA